MLQALGVRFTDNHGRDIGRGGGALSDLAHIDCSALDQRLLACEFMTACDVNNPLTGPQGAAHVFGPQKGASPEMVIQLDASLSRFAQVVERDLGKRIENVPGAGAAGGMGAALLGFLDAELKPGIEIVIEAVRLEELMFGADLVITGEGRIDGQSVHGKAPVGVALIAKKHHIPVIGLAGSLGEGAEKVKEFGISALYSIVKGPCDLSEALSMAAENLQSISKNIAATIWAFIAESP